MPLHVNPDPNAKDRTAIAPYNFVPLPNKIFVVEDGIDVNGKKMKPWEHHDEFVPGTYSGWIDLTIQTLTPLFIRGPIRRKEDGAWDERESRFRPEPFQTSDGRPVIPGSSLRGMVRNLVEILSFAKLQPVSQARPFFRDISQGRIGNAYRKHFIEELSGISSGINIVTRQHIKRPAPGYRSRVQAGIIATNAQGQKVIRCCGLARIEHGLLKQQFGPTLLVGKGPMAVPNWSIQAKEVFVQVDAQPKNYFFVKKERPNGKPRHTDLYLQFRLVTDISLEPQDGYKKGVLVLTGDIPNKHLEFVFLEEPVHGKQEILIPKSIWDHFHDEGQITQWQELAFPKNQPKGGSRRSDGFLRDGEPVFYLTDQSSESEGDPANEDNPDRLIFLGRAQMFRFPYDKSPEDLIPEELRKAGLDLAEAMFGRVTDDGEAIKGRVFFEDAFAIDGGPDWFVDIIVPHILSAPKVTAVQHYLTQDGARGPRELTTYLEGDQTTIRGHKLYWHRWNKARGLDEVKEQPQKKHDEIRDALLNGCSDKYRGYTIIRPVRDEVTFEGKIRFENLTKLELGALLAALQLPEGCEHKLGMGKPLGLGSVHIDVQLNLVCRERRYSSWDNDGVQPSNRGEFLEAFAQAILKHAKESDETFLQHEKGLRQTSRLDALFTMLEWRNRPALQNTRYMRIENGEKARFGDSNEFRNRPILPSPQRVVGKAEPPRRNDLPRPANHSGHGN